MIKLKIEGDGGEIVALSVALPPPPPAPPPPQQCGQSHSLLGGASQRY